MTLWLDIIYIYIYTLFFIRNHYSFLNHAPVNSMARSTLLLLILSLFAIFPYYYVYSYCIYNNMDDNTEVFAYQSYGQRAVAQLPK